MWKIRNELEKLSVYSGQLSVREVENLVRPKIEAKIFDLVDAFGEKNAKKAHQELSKLLEKDEAELYIFTMIVGQFRNILIIKDYLNPNDKAQSSNQAQNSKFQIAKELGMHPFVAQKTSFQAKNFTLDELKKIYQKLMDFDIKIKTGEIEPRLALDLLIAEICR